MLRKILIAGGVLVALVAVYVLWSTQNALANLAQAPQGQALGPADAKVTVVELLDYRCGACRATHPMMQRIVEANPDVRFVFNHLPIFVEPSVAEARIALAAGLQGKFFDMHNVLIARAEPVKDEEIETLSRQVGADPVRLKKDMLDKSIKDRLLDTVNAAQMLQIRATPTYIINREIFSSEKGLPTEEQLNALIEQARRGEKPRHEKPATAPPS